MASKTGKTKTGKPKAKALGDIPADLFDLVPGEIDFSKQEDKILEYWNKINAFETSLKQSEGKQLYSFYDGPPFATGLMNNQPNQTKPNQTKPNQTKPPRSLLHFLFCLLCFCLLCLI